ncbi:hypothetical protein B1R45_13565 [Pseudomonas azotoformans]|nr:hypothetical protein B1R45_13565 [Pseudomonas azotoformans]
MAFDALFCVDGKPLVAAHATAAWHRSFQLDAGADVAAARADPATVVALVDFAFRLRVIGEAAFPRWRAAQLEAAPSAYRLSFSTVMHGDLQCLGLGGEL